MQSIDLNVLDATFGDPDRDSYHALAFPLVVRLEAVGGHNNSHGVTAGIATWGLANDRKRDLPSHILEAVAFEGPSPVVEPVRAPDQRLFLAGKTPAFSLPAYAAKQVTLPSFDVPAPYGNTGADVDRLNSAAERAAFAGHAWLRAGVYVSADSRPAEWWQLTIRFSRNALGQAPRVTQCDLAPVSRPVAAWDVDPARLDAPAAA